MLSMFICNLFLIILAQIYSIINTAMIIEEPSTNQNIKIKRKRKGQRKILVTPAERLDAGLISTYRAVVYYGLRCAKDERNHLAIGHHRSADSRLEFAIMLTYENSSEFREQIAAIRNQLTAEKSYIRQLNLNNQHRKLTSDGNRSPNWDETFANWSPNGYTYAILLEIYLYGGRGFGHTYFTGWCVACEVNMDFSEDVLIILNRLLALLPEECRQKIQDYHTETKKNNIRKNKRKSNKTVLNLQGASENTKAIIIYGLRCLADRRKGEVAGHHRSAENRAEFAVIIMFNHCESFRKAIENVRNILTSWRRQCRIMNEVNQHRQLMEPPYYDSDERMWASSTTSGCTYGKLLEMYDYGGNGFDSPKAGTCSNCNHPLPVWRRCKWCFGNFVDNVGEGAIALAYVECYSLTHLLELDDPWCDRCNGLNESYDEEDESRLYPSDYEFFNRGLLY